MVRLKCKVTGVEVDFKYLIIGIYDSGYGFKVCNNGIVHTVDNMNPNIATKIHDLYVHSDTPFQEAVLEAYGDKYDFIVISEDAEIEVIKEGDKEL